MSNRILIESNAPDDSLCTCSNCDWSGPLSDVNDVEFATLEAGDASPAGRCRECDSLVYLDRPEDRASDALDTLLWVMGKGYPVGDSNLIAAADALAQSLSDASSRRLTFTISIGDAQ